MPYAIIEIQQQENRAYRKGGLHMRYEAESTAGTQYTFDGFEVTKANRNAFEKAKQFAAQADAKPLAIFGGTASGKTHLLYAVRNAILQTAPELNVMFITTAQMQASLTDILQSGGSTAQFRTQYEQADILLVDDVQALAGKIAVQEQLILIFNTFYEAGKRFMMTSAQKNATEKLSDRLVIRAFWGDFAVITQSYAFAVFSRDTQRSEKCRALLSEGESFLWKLMRKRDFALEKFKSYFKEVWQYFSGYVGLFDVDREDLLLLNDLNCMMALMRCNTPCGVRACERETCILFLNALIRNVSSYDVRAYRGSFYREGILYISLPHHGGTSGMIEITTDEFEQWFDTFCDDYSKHGRF